MSRQLIYISGLLTCYRCHLDYDARERVQIYHAEGSRNDVVERLQEIFRATPLDMVAGVLLRYPHLSGAARKLIGSYDEFVGILADDGSREQLECLQDADADTDPVFQKARALSHEFRDGVLELFFDEASGMSDLTKNYGVF